MIKTLLVLWIATAFLFSFVFSQSLLYIGNPKVRVVTTLDGTVKVKKQQIQPKDKKANTVVITKDEDNNIFWSSRENTLLNISKSGVYTILTALNGSGYVKVDLENELYIEHVHIGLTTITYYGVSGVYIAE